MNSDMVLHFFALCGTRMFMFQLRAVEISGVNDILHLLFSAKGLDNKVIIFIFLLHHFISVISTTAV